MFLTQAQLAAAITREETLTATLVAAQEKIVQLQAEMSHLTEYSQKEVTDAADSATDARLHLRNTEAALLKSEARVASLTAEVCRYSDETWMLGVIHLICG